MSKWMVFTRRPNKPSLAWEYSRDYFPRSFHYKSDANRAAQMAKLKGGIGVVLKPFIQSEFEQESRLVRESKYVEI